MGLHKSIVKRIRKIESRTTQPRWRVVVKDLDGLYRGECGEGLSEQQFNEWVKQQDKDTQVIIVDVNWDPPVDKEAAVHFKVQNYADRNISDFLEGYDELIKISQLPETQIIAKSVESQVSAVDPNCGCFTNEQAMVIAQAQEIIRNAPIH